MPFLLFSGVLCGMLLLSWWLLLPRVTSVEIGGQSIPAVHLTEFASNLRADIAQATQERDAVVYPKEHALHASLLKQKSRQPELLPLMGSVRSAAQHLEQETGGRIVLHSMEFHPEERMLRLAGDVRGVGSRSMTVLAQYIEELQRQSVFTSVSSPRFERQDDPEIGLHSPFVLQLVTHE